MKTIKPKYKIGDGVVIKTNNYHSLCVVIGAYLPISLKVWEYALRSHKNEYLWIKETEINQ